MTKFTEKLIKKYVYQRKISTTICYIPPRWYKKSNISVSWPTIIGVKNIECQLDDEKWDIFYKVHPNKTQPVQLNDTSKWFRS